MFKIVGMIVVYGLASFGAYKWWQQAIADDNRAARNRPSKVVD